MLPSERPIPLPKYHKGLEQPAIRVAATGRTNAIAEVITRRVREHGYARIQAMGLISVNQAVKAITVAHRFLKTSHIEAICIPYLTNIMLDGEERTIIGFLVEPR